MTSFSASCKLFISSILTDEVESLFDFATSNQSGHEPSNETIYTIGRVNALQNWRENSTSRFVV